MNSIWIYLLASVKCFQNTKYYIGHPSSLNFTGPILSLPAKLCTLLSVVGYSETPSPWAPRAWPNTVLVCCSCQSRPAFGPPTLCSHPSTMLTIWKKILFSDLLVSQYKHMNTLKVQKLMIVTENVYLPQHVIWGPSPHSSPPKPSTVRPHAN